MGLEWTYDSFVGLSFGFFAAFISVRLTHEVGNGLDQLRRQWRQRRATAGKRSALRHRDAEDAEYAL